MTKVSRLPLRKDLLERIFRLFIKTIVGIHNNNTSERFVFEFFTPTERVMFAKRLAACVLLAKKCSYQEISSKLKMSPTTITSLSYWVNHEGEGINEMVGQIIKRQKNEILIEEIVDLFDLPRKQIYNLERIKRKAKRERRINELKSGI